MPAHWCSRLSQELLTFKSVAKMKPYMSGVYNKMFEAVSTSKSLGYCQENTDIWIIWLISHISLYLVLIRLASIYFYTMPFNL